MAVSDKNGDFPGFSRLIYQEAILNIKLERRKQCRIQP